jgi:hypothetical protein
MSVHYPDDQEFLTHVTDSLDGWLLRPAAHLTLTLLEAQRGLEPSRGCLEIGIYAGKSLSLLLREVQAHPGPILAIDTCQFIAMEHIRATLGQVLALPETLYLHKGKSTDFRPAGILRILGGPVRFVSIDGSHMAPDVLFDLHLAAAVSAEAALVSVDDALNPRALGVNEALARFFIGGGDGALAPFCYCTNKLFLCPPAYTARYTQQAEAFIRTHTHYPESQQFIALDAQWRGAVEVEYFGHPVLVIH